MIPLLDIEDVQVGDIVYSAKVKSIATVTDITLESDNIILVSDLWCLRTNTSKVDTTTVKLPVINMHNLYLIDTKEEALLKI
jgi:hypothetical protein